MSQEKKPIIDKEVTTTSHSYPEWHSETTIYKKSDLETAEAKAAINATEVPLKRHANREGFDAKMTEKPAPLSRRARIKAESTAGSNASQKNKSTKTRTNSTNSAVTSTVVPSRRNASTSAKGSKATENHKNQKRKPKLWIRMLKWAFLLVCCCLIIGGGAGLYYVYSVISETPPIDPSNIAEMLNETSIMYDADGNEMDVIFYGANRDIASINNVPKHLQDAFIAIEDKTFRTHHGFNITRIFGAIWEYIRPGGGDQISGTSTITQQLARNVFLTDTQFAYSLKRKIAEAYYALKIEKALSKDEIMEAYLNTIYFGYGSWGIETAAQSYFQKSANQLTIAESAALAALPQYPTGYQLVNFIEGGTTEQYPDIALKETSDGVYVINDMSRERRRLCLSLMLEQELITQSEYDAAIQVELRDMLNPDFTTYNSGYSTYFADYVITDVINDLQAEKGVDYNTAWRMVYQGGLTIYSTMDPTVQQIVTEEFENPDNFLELYPVFDSEDNIINDNGAVVLRPYDNTFDENGNYYLNPYEYDRLADGRMIIYRDNFLNIYTTDVNGETDYSLEFPQMYSYDDNWDMYSISGGYINIPMNYKSANSDGDLVINANFFNDYPDFFNFQDDGSCSIPPSSYTLGSRIIQPQGAMTIIENSTGHIIAMVGGRGTTGRQILNRAITPRQAGSSIKPLSVYSAALQQSVEEMRNGQNHTFVNYGIDKQGANLYGSYLTAASIVVDEKMNINGEEWPKNYSKKYSGPVTLRQALVSSLNTCAAKILYQVGIDYSIQNVEKFGITTLVKEGDVNDLNIAALALGAQTYGVTTLEMASAFTVFPNNGVRYEPSSYTKVLDRHGNILLENNPEPDQVLDPGVAWIMADMMHAVPSGTLANLEGTFVGGKTGTTENSYDIWFDGFTNNYSAAFWMGSDFGSPLSGMSNAALATWGTIMRRLDGAYLGERAPMPDDVIYYQGEYFVEGTEKGTKTIKDYQKTVTICKDTGLLATPECTNTEKKEYVSYDDEAAEEIPKEYCYLHNPDPSKYPTTEEGQKHIDEENKKKEAENKAAADPVIALINALPANPTSADQAAIAAARAAYNALSDDQKAAVGNENLAKLASAEAKLDDANKAEEARRQAEEEAARNAAYQAWLIERENHRIKTKVIDVPYQAATEDILYTQEEFDAYVANNGSNPSWNVGDVKTPGTPEIPEEFHYEDTGEYEQGWRDGDFTYP